MKTASFFTYQGPGRISIARYAPRGISGFRIYHQLAPTRAMLKMEYAEYRELYFRDILGPLDPEQVWRDLHQLVHPHEPVLLSGSIHRSRRPTGVTVVWWPNGSKTISVQRF
jgi:hypothetical protein